MKFSEPTTYRDALREVEERINGNQNPLSKSNYSMQLDPHEKALYDRAQVHGSAAQSKMMLVAGGLAHHKTRQTADNSNSKHRNPNQNAPIAGWSSGLDPRLSAHPVK